MKILVAVKRVIDHAIRVTVVRTRGDFVFPASHASPNSERAVASRSSRLAT